MTFTAIATVLSSATKAAVPAPVAETQVPPAETATIDTTKSTARAQQVAELIAKQEETIKRVEADQGLPEGLLKSTIAAHLSSLSEKQFTEVSEQLAGNRPDSKGYENDKEGAERVGLGLVSIRSSVAADTDGANVDFYLKQDYDKHYQKLSDPVKNIEVLGQVLRENYEHNGKVDGKADADRWKFAVAKHLSDEPRGREIGEAQSQARTSHPREEGFFGPIGPDPANSWDLVKAELRNKALAETVDKIATAAGL